MAAAPLTIAKTAITHLPQTMMGTAGIYWATRAKLANGTVWKEIGYCLSGSTTLEEEAPTKTQVQVEQLSIPIAVAYKKGGLSYSAKLPDVSKEILVDLFGAIVNSGETSTTNNCYFIGDEIHVKNGMFMIAPKTGAGTPPAGTPIAAIFTNASMVARIVDSPTDEAPACVEITVTALGGDPSGTFEKDPVAYVYQPAG